MAKLAPRALAIVVYIFASCAASRNGLGRTPLMGWSTWCTSAACYQGGDVAVSSGGLHDFCNEDMILSSAAAVVSTGMRDSGYNHIMIDDCWAHTSRDANGDLQPDPARFPNGMPALVNAVHALNLSIGLYTSVGPTTCSSGNRTGKIPGSYGHYDRDAALYARWQVDAMTMDWCDYVVNGSVLLPTVQTQQMSDSLNKTGRPIWFLFHCIGYGIVDSTWCAEWGNSYTVSTDKHDNWNTTMWIFIVLAEHPSFVGAETLTWPDPDFLMTGGAGCEDLSPGRRCPGMTDDEYRSEFTITSLAGGQLVVSTDIRNMSTLQREILLNHEILAVFNDTLKQLGSLVQPAESVLLPYGVSVWFRPLSGGCGAVALLNGAETPLPGRVEFDWLPKMNWTNATVLGVRDLWAHADLGEAKGSFTVPAPIPPHATVALRLC